MNPPISDPNSPEGNSTQNRAALERDARPTRWGWGLISLWVYSLVMMALTAIGAFLPYPLPSSPQQAAQDALMGGLMLSPVAVFIVLVGIRNFQR